MDFTRVARFWKEDAVAREAAVQSSEKAAAGGEKQVSGTNRAKDRQKAQMATQSSVPMKSDVSYASEGYKPFPKDKVTRKIKALDTEKALGMGSPKKDKRRMKMDMAVYVDKDPELRGMHRSAKQTIEKENRERGRKRMEEERRQEREYAKMWENNKSDWRKDLKEAMKPGEEGTHPYVDVMPSVNQKAMEVKKQMKGAAELEGGKQAKMAEEYGETVQEYNRRRHEEHKKKMKEVKNIDTGKVTKLKTEAKELSIDDQMKISQKAAEKRNPKPDHKAIRAKLLKKPLPKDSRTDAQKMTDATGPRPGSRFRGD